MPFELFSKELRKLLSQKGFIEPTLPQKIGIPEIKKGSDVLIIAPTGIGKTESAILPLLDKIHLEKSAPINVLYITPLRALNRDLLERLAWWAEKLDIELAVRHGDTTQSERQAQVEIPPHVLITTPESLNAMLLGKKLREHLKNIRHVVIDEIHELVESKRGVQLSLSLERLAEIAGNFQRIGLSATIGSPETVAKFLGKNVKIIRAESQKKYDISVECPQTTAKDIVISDELFISIETVAKLRKLYELISSHMSVIAFTNTRQTAEVLSSRLRQLDKELKQEVHHGSLSKEHRIKSEQKFKSRELRSIIATSSLELGIDIGSVDLVIQYLSPRRVARLIQRVGRAGHGVGRTSRGVVISGEEDLFESIIIADMAMNKELEPVRMHDSAMDALASQVVGLSMEYFDISDEQILRIAKRAYPFRNLSMEKLHELLKFLADLRIIWLNPTPLGFRIRRSRKAWTYYFENLSMIPNTIQYKIISIIEGEPVGTLDEAFVAEHARPGDRFIVSGRAWKVLGIDKRIVRVEPSDRIESAIPAWEGELIPVPFEVSQRVGRLRRLIASSLKNPEALAEKIRDTYKIDLASISEISGIIEKHQSKHTVPDDKTWLIEDHSEAGQNFVIIHACNGSMVNDTIGRYIAALLTAEIGVAVNVKTDPYRIMLQTAVKPEAVRKILATSKPGELKKILEVAIEHSSLFQHRFLHVARRLGIISKQVAYDQINMSKIIQNYYSSPAFDETMREIFTDKFDLENSEIILGQIKTGKIKLVVEKGLSYLGELGLVHKFAEIIKPALPQEEIFRAFSRRLMHTVVRLVCTNCGNYTIAKPVSEIDDYPECPECNSRLIGVVYKGTKDIGKTIKKQRDKKLLTEDQQQALETAKRSAELVIVYGRQAVVVLAGRGIGPETAARILATRPETKEKLLKAVLEAEKQYAKTRMYWR